MLFSIVFVPIFAFFLIASQVNGDLKLDLTQPSDLREQFGLYGDGHIMVKPALFGMPSNGLTLRGQVQICSMIAIISPPYFETILVLTLVPDAAVLVKRHGTGICM